VQPGVSGFKSGLVNIWSVQGKLLASKKFNANTIVVIRISGFPVGPYIIRVENEDTAQSWVQKIK
ncbi:MAG: hypothetical protein LBT25_07255, partial [Candidatus Symbiothrix sp.]|nr:hypothetical protein [Candidatus Symbiothrix sp.]